MIKKALLCDCFSNMENVPHVFFYFCNTNIDFFPSGNLFYVLWEISLYPLSLPSLFTSNHRHTFQSLTSPTAAQHAPYYLPSSVHRRVSGHTEKIIRKILFPRWNHYIFSFNFYYIDISPIILCYLCNIYYFV